MSGQSRTFGRDQQLQRVEDVREPEDQGAARSVGEDRRVVGEAAVQHPHVSVPADGRGEGQVRDGRGGETGLEEISVRGELGDDPVLQAEPGDLGDRDEQTPRADLIGIVR